MRLLFIHDHPFYKDGELVYSGGGLPASVWANYHLNFEEILVYGRNSILNHNKGVLSSSANVNFYLTDLYTSKLSFLKNKNKIVLELEVLMKDVDVVLLRLPSILGFLAFKVAKKLNKVIWIEQVGNCKEAFGSQGSISGKLIAGYLDGLNRKIVQKSDFLSYVTKNQLQKDYPPKNDAIVCSASNVVIKKVLFESELDLNRFYGTNITIGLIGGFDVRYKGQDILLKAIASLEPSIKNKIEIVLVGKGDYSWIQDLIIELGLEKNILFLGSLEAGNAVNEQLSKLSLYVQPSLTEGMPRATIEAMAMGCPVIGSNVGGIPDIVNKRFLHERGNVTKLANDILELFSNRDLLFEESKMSITKAEEYRLEKIIGVRKDFYNQMNIKLKN